MKSWISFTIFTKKENSEIADILTYPIQRKNHQLNASLHHVAQDKLIWKFLFSLQADSDTNGAKSNMKWHLDFYTFPGFLNQYMKGIKWFYSYYSHLNGKAICFRESSRILMNWPDKLSGYEFLNNSAAICSSDEFGLVEKLTNANGILIHFTSFYLNYFLTSPVRILFVENKAGIETLPLWHNREEQPMI